MGTADLESQWAFLRIAYAFIRTTKKLLKEKLSKLEGSSNLTNNM
jgi:hypothetical protein